jgi:hypothetical protein
MTLGFVQLCLTGAFQTVIPYIYLSRVAGSEPEVAAKLKQLDGMSQAVDPGEMTPAELEERSQILAPLFERVPWIKLGLLACVVIYPFLGRMAGGYLSRPESAGILILLSASLGQNPATIPMALQHAGLGSIALPLWVVVLMIVFEFALLAAGILSEPKVRERL